MNKDVLFIFTDKYYGMILDCRKINNDQYEILTKCHGLLKVDKIILFQSRKNFFSLPFNRIPVDKQFDNLYVPLIPNMVLFYYVYSKVLLN
jgi:hypothetical protein